MFPRSVEDSAGLPGTRVSRRVGAEGGRYAPLWSFGHFSVT